MRGAVLVVDDDDAMREMLESDLGRRGYDCLAVDSGTRALEELSRRQVDVLLADVRMPRMTGIELCRRVATEHPEVLVVLITAFGSLATAIEALRAGAYDFATKPIDLELLDAVLNRAVQHRQLSERVARLDEEVRRVRPVGSMLGESAPMLELYEQIQRTARTDVSVLLSGETGTGKELVARAIHAASARSNGPFVGVNCAALPEGLLESEIFGHVAGAFTGSRGARKGLFQQASGGTLLLDEVGEMPLPFQSKLLRALEERRIRPLGADVEVTVDVRVIAASNLDLEQAVERGAFREDLYYRLAVVEIPVPPLRLRGSDVLLLAQHFVEQLAERSGKGVRGITDAAARKLRDYSWPGNVRELRNAMERAVTLTQDSRLSVKDLPARIRKHRPTELVIGDELAALVPLEEIERRYIEHVLRTVGGNRTTAARVLGVDRKTLYRKLTHYAHGEPVDDDQALEPGD